jgi:hypothetical protein
LHALEGLPIVVVDNVADLVRRKLEGPFKKKVATGDGILLLLGVTPDVLASSVATGCQIFLAMNY